MPTLRVEFILPGVQGTLRKKKSAYHDGHTRVGGSQIDSNHIAYICALESSAHVKEGRAQGSLRSIECGSPATKTQLKRHVCLCVCLRDMLTNWRNFEIGRDGMCGFEFCPHDVQDYTRRWQSRWPVPGTTQKPGIYMYEYIWGTRDNMYCYYFRILLVLFSITRDFPSITKSSFQENLSRSELGLHINWMGALWSVRCAKFAMAVDCWLVNFKVLCWNRDSSSME